MWLVSALASGFPEDEGTPRDVGHRGRPDAGFGGSRADGSAAGHDEHRGGELSQEEILDLIVEAMLAQGDLPPEEDDLTEEDDWGTDGPWDTRDSQDIRDSQETRDNQDMRDSQETRYAQDARGPQDAQDPQEEDSEPGWGFGSDKPLDLLRPGPALAGMADTVRTSALLLVSDDELTGIIKAWQRITSWATAREFGAIAELARRRPDDATDSAFARRVRARLAAGESPQSAQRGDSAQHAESAGATPAAQAEGSADGHRGAESDLPELISPFASCELAMALTLTAHAAEAHLELATELASKLPKTAAALEAGVIDIARARIIAEATRVLSKELTAAVENLIFPRAGQQTSGQLRAALARAVLAADPDAARRRREESQRDARVLRWREDAGTAALCGRDLPSAEVLAADQRISARARELKSAGVKGTMDELRARAYLDFLLGRNSVPQETEEKPEPATPTSAAPPAGGSTASSPPAGGPPAGGLRVTSWTTGGPPGSLAARINVTVPLSTIFGFSDAPGEVAAFGPVDADLARELVTAAGLHPGTRWCVTVVGPDGQAVGHGCAHGRHTAPPFPPPGNGDRPPSNDINPPSGDAGPPGNGGDAGPPGDSSDDGPPGDNGGQRRSRERPGGSPPGPSPKLRALNLQAREFMRQLGVRVIPLAVGTCDHRNEEPGYKPSRRLRHLIGARTVCCSAPGCRRPAAQCDFDHTIAYEAGGRSCECNVRPLCRRHHRCKQAPGWALEQPNPGTLIWTTPAGRRYKTVATRYYL